MMVVVIISERNKSTWVDRAEDGKGKIDTGRRDGDYTCLAKGKHRPRTIVQGGRTQ